MSEVLVGRKLTVRILSYVLFSFITYFSIGITLAVLPTFAHARLGVDALTAGLLISLQYVATFLTRPRAGIWTDTIGPKKTLRIGLIACTAAGALLCLGALCANYFWISLLFIGLSRLAMGTGESFGGTGSTMWAIGRVGSQNTAKVISFNGVATYSGLAIGAPVGVVIEKYVGLPAVGSLIFIVCLLALTLAKRFPATSPVAGERFSIGRILMKVTPFGLLLALGGLGFGMIATFITLYFNHQSWDGAAIALTIFGFCFVSIRLVFPNAIAKFGGFRVTQISLVIEAIGLLVMAYGPGVSSAYLASALIGVGFALVFPALAVEMVKTFPLSMHGSAIGIYNAFTDLSLFLTGPVAGLIIEHYGYRTNFLLTALAVSVAVIGAVILERRVN